MKPTLPEPEVLDRHLPTNTPITRGYTWKTVQRLIDEAYAAGLEEAAKRCDVVQRMHSDHADIARDCGNEENQAFFEGAMVGAEDCADKIRALKDGS